MQEATPTSNVITLYRNKESRIKVDTLKTVIGYSIWLGLYLQSCHLGRTTQLGQTRLTQTESTEAVARLSSKPSITNE